MSDHHNYQTCKCGSASTSPCLCNDPVQMIFEERKRQITSEGWTYGHDDEHRHEELARAAACYAMPKFWRVASVLEMLWPWDTSWWKPKDNDRIRDLVKAGALIVAEIERLQRVEARK